MRRILRTAGAADIGAVRYCYEQNPATVAEATGQTMDPQVSGFALGLLLGAVKITFIGMVGFGIAWLRARTRIRKLEDAARFQAESGVEARLAGLEEGIEFISTQLQQMLAAQPDPVRLAERSDPPIPPRAN